MREAGGSRGGTPLGLDAKYNDRHILLYTGGYRIIKGHN